MLKLVSIILCVKLPDETVVDVNNIAKEKGYVKKGDALLNLLAMPVASKGMVNTLRVSVIKE